jgi:hypothetical protein
VSLAEIKNAIDQLSDEDQLHVQRYLHDKTKPSADRIAQWSRVMEEMDAGKKFSVEQVEELCRRLEQNDL